MRTIQTVRGKAVKQSGLPVLFAGMSFILSLVIGLFSSVSFFAVIGRSILAAAFFALFGYTLHRIIRRFLPELVYVPDKEPVKEASPEEDKTMGNNVNTIVDAGPDDESIYTEGTMDTANIMDTANTMDTANMDADVPKTFTDEDIEAISRETPDTMAQAIRTVLNQDKDAT